MVLAGQAQTILQVYAAYSIGIGAGVGCAYVPTLGAVQRWFVRRRGFASGLAVSGIGVGTLVMPPLATWLIASFGWRDAYVVLGVVAARRVTKWPDTLISTFGLIFYAMPSFWFGLMAIVVFSIYLQW
ncbi:MFS transporter, partial [Klebsiella pneumoniae]